MTDNVVHFPTRNAGLCRQTRAGFSNIMRVSATGVLAMMVLELMTPKPEVVRSLDTVRLAAALMRARGVGMLPVVDDLQSRTLCGVITDRDIAVRCVAEHAHACLVRDHMTTSPLATVGIDDDIALALAGMERNHVRRLPVVDYAGRVVGVIAQSDLAAARTLRKRAVHLGPAKDHCHSPG